MNEKMSVTEVITMLDRKNESIVKSVYEISNDFINEHDYNDINYLSDSFSYQADSYTDIYYSDLKKWLCENVDAFESYIDEFGYNANASLYDNIMSAQYFENERMLYEDESEIVQCLFINYLKHVICCEDDLFKIDINRNELNKVINDLNDFDEIEDAVDDIRMLFEY